MSLRLSSIDRNNKRYRRFEKRQANNEAGQIFQAEKPQREFSLFIAVFSRQPLLGMCCLLVMAYASLEIYMSLSVPNIYPVTLDNPELNLGHAHDAVSRRTGFASNGCRHTKQGGYLVCDSNGAVCAAREVDVESSCCLEYSEGYDKFSCKDCHAGCCPSYEVCVSCCLRPEHISMLDTSTSNDNIGRLNIPQGVLQDLARDEFEWCMYACKTSSRSLLPTENSYSSKYFLHCYSLATSSPIDRQSVNSDRSTACSSPDLPGWHHTLCSKDEEYPIINNHLKRRRKNILRDYG